MAISETCALLGRAENRRTASSSRLSIYGGPELIGPMVYIKTYIFDHFYPQYLVLLTMAPRNIDVDIPCTLPHTDIYKVPCMDKYKRKAQMVSHCRTNRSATGAPQASLERALRRGSGRSTKPICRHVPGM